MGGVQSTQDAIASEIDDPVAGVEGVEDFVERLERRR